MLRHHWAVARLFRRGAAMRPTASYAGGYQTLFDELVARLGLSWPLFIGVLLILPYATAVLLIWATIGFEEMPGEGWRSIALPGVMMAYSVIAYRVNLPARARALAAFRKVVQVTDDEFSKLITSGCTLRRSHEALAIGAGGLAGLFIMKPWLPGEKVDPSFIWTMVFMIPMFGMIGWLIFQSLANTRLMTLLHKERLSLDILDPEPVRPMAVWSLRVAAAFFGGITVSLLFLSRSDLVDPSTYVVYVILGLSALAVFFFTLRSTHREMAAVKQREERLVRGKIIACAERLKGMPGVTAQESIVQLSSELEAWTNYQRHIKESSSWPFSTSVLQRLALAGLTPALLYVGKIAPGLTTSVR